jgi:hypothetical protein
VHNAERLRHAPLCLLNVRLVFSLERSNSFHGSMETTDEMSCDSNRSVFYSSSPYNQLNPNDIWLVDILPGNLDNTIQVALRTVDLTTEPHYEALSYVWNPKDGTIADDAEPERVTIQGYEDFPVLATPNLASAIHDLRNDFSVRTMWIDAICIHQASDAEKSHQVALMGEIYARAKLVVIWLGPSQTISSGEDLSSNSDSLMDIFAAGRIDDRAWAEHASNMEFFCRRKWFRRVWIAQ